MAQHEYKAGCRVVRCKSCNKKIVFGILEEGKKVPLDVVAPVYQLVGTRAIRIHQGYVSHFATCPDASKHSKKGDKS